MSALRSILYVEDDPDIQSIGKLSLETIGGFKVTTCDNGQAAVAALTQAGDYQLVLLDVMMPQMDGTTTFRLLRQLPAGRTIPVIFCTAKVQKSEIEAYLAQGALGVIEKPFDAMALPGQIQKIWEQSQK